MRIKAKVLASRVARRSGVSSTGGTGRPNGFKKGYYVRPTIFANVTNAMTIAREEIFGPVLVMIPSETEEEAVRIANDTPYGLSGYVFGGTLEHARRVAARLRTGMVHVNDASLDFAAPFGGYHQSGNGREWGAATRSADRNEQRAEPNDGHAVGKVTGASGGDSHRQRRLADTSSPSATVFIPTTSLATTGSKK